MPYRDEKKRKKYHREYMRKWRQEKKKKLEQLKREFPDVYSYVFGLDKRREKGET